MFNPKLIYLLSILPITMFVFGCNDYPADSIDEQYAAAVSDAVFIAAEEINENLISITHDNDEIIWNNGMVLVVTFTKYPESYTPGETIETWWGETWVTVVPELQTFFENNVGDTDNYLLRTEQLLGLPQNTGYEWFAEMWVNPDDLFRPCPDSDITDSVCEVDFPADASAEYIDWFNNLILQSYFQEPNYPWTRLGYTYDWNTSTSEVGVSEFIIRQHSQVVVESLQRVDEYL